MEQNASEIECKIHKTVIRRCTVTGLETRAIRKAEMTGKTDNSDESAGCHDGEVR